MSLLEFLKQASAGEDTQEGRSLDLYSQSRDDSMMESQLQNGEFPENFDEFQRYFTNFQEGSSQRSFPFHPRSIQDYLESYDPTHFQNTSESKTGLQTRSRMSRDYNTGVPARSKSILDNQGRNTGAAGLNIPGWLAELPMSRSSSILQPGT